MAEPDIEPLNNSLCECGHGWSTHGHDDNAEGCSECGCAHFAEPGIEPLFHSVEDCVYCNEPLNDSDPDADRCPHCGAPWQTLPNNGRAIQHRPNCAWLADQRRIAGVGP